LERAILGDVRAVVLAGGTGGAKLAAGMQELLADELAVVVNTGDDVEVLGVPVSPDPDLVTYWLSGEIDEERGWGIRGDSFTVFERLVALGAPSWFGLSDRDLATCLRRRALLDAGQRPTAVQAQIAAALGARAQVLPMSDQPVRTRVRTPAGWIGLQEFLVREGARPPILETSFDGVEEAAPSPEVAESVAAADAIVIGPSNPVISIEPILSVPGMREAIRSADAPTVAVSPYVGGRILKGPTAEFMRAAGYEGGAAGVATAYQGMIAGMVVDQGDPGGPPAGLATLAIATLMDTPAARRAVAERVLEFARTLG
jgi:LPPG:FO 2-phospho-L-lactate transferase